MMGILSWIMLCHRDLSCASRKLSSILSLMCQMPVALPRLWKIKMSPIASMFSHIQFSVTLWTVAHQAPLSVGFSRQEYWSGLPFPTPGHLPDAGIEPMSPESPALAGRFFIIVPPGKPCQCLLGREGAKPLVWSSQGSALAFASSISTSSGEPLVLSGPDPLLGWGGIVLSVCPGWLAMRSLQLWAPPPCAVGAGNNQCREFDAKRFGAGMWLSEPTKKREYCVRWIYQTSQSYL